MVNLHKTLYISVTNLKSDNMNEQNGGYNEDICWKSSL